MAYKNKKDPKIYDPAELALLSIKDETSSWFGFGSPLPRDRNTEQQASVEALRSELKAIKKEIPNLKDRYKHVRAALIKYEATGFRGEDPKIPVLGESTGSYNREKGMRIYLLPMDADTRNEVKQVLGVMRERGIPTRLSETSLEMKSAAHLTRKPSDPAPASTEATPLALSFGNVALNPRGYGTREHEASSGKTK